MTSTDRGCGGARRPTLVLAPGVRVDAAGERQALDDAAIDALLDPDARADLRFTSLQ